MLVSCVIAQVEIKISNKKTVIDGKEYFLHTVSRGETLYSISRAYNVKIDDIRSANPDMGESLTINKVLRIPIPPPEEVDRSKYIVHVVKSGETLYSLLRKYEVSEEEFYEHNSGLEKGFVLSIDQLLFFPRKSDDKEIKTSVEEIETVKGRDTVRFIYHKLKEGETIYALSRKYDVPRLQILSANPGIDENNLSVGQEIKVPRVEGFTAKDKQNIIDSLAMVNFYLKPPKRVDTVKFVEDEVIIPCDSLLSEITRPVVNIVVLLPFEAESNMEQLLTQKRTNRELQIMPISQTMVNFLYGCLIALDEFSDSGVEINFNIYDAGSTNTVINKLIEDGTIDNADLIIGPAYRSQIVYLAENRKSKNTIIILPFTSDNSYVENYENVFMVRTSSFYQRKAIVDFAVTYSDKNYLIVYENTEENIHTANQYLNEIKDKSADADVNKLLFDETELVGLSNLLDDDKENVIIFTFSGEYKAFRIFTQLYPLQEYNISILGNKSFLDYETIDPKYFLDNNYAYHSSIKIDYSDRKVKDFITGYREEFLSEPDDYSFIGYDIVNIFTHGYMYYGNQISNCINFENNNKALTGNIIFSREKDFANK